ncbi:MAG TPA: hypothetical protein VGD67_06805, partial [Pseudonocardiaceae bacterium]
MSAPASRPPPVLALRRHQDAVILTVRPASPSAPPGDAASSTSPTLPTPPTTRPRGTPAGARPSAVTRDATPPGAAALRRALAEAAACRVPLVVVDLTAVRPLSPAAAAALA